MAGTAQAQSDVQVEEVVVTAQKREGTVQATPLAVSAISGDGCRPIIFALQDALEKLAPELPPLPADNALDAHFAEDEDDSGNGADTDSNPAP